MAPRNLRRRIEKSGPQPLSPQRKWQSITVATLLLVPAFWSMMVGLVSIASDGDEGGPQAGAAIAFGLSLIPFVFVVLAFMSEHPRAPQAVVRAMGLTLLVGIPVSALTIDAVTGLVAGAGAGGIVALRSDPPHNWKARAYAVLAASLYTFVLVRLVGALALLPAPIFPFTGIGVADHISEWRERESRASSESDS